MSSFNGTPLAVRTRPMLPGLGMVPPNDAQQLQSAAASPPQTLTIRPRKRKASAEPEQPPPPEPANPADLERTPSPFIKEEPFDNRTYTAHTVADDEGDAYNPNVPMGGIVGQPKPAPKLYNPEHPMVSSDFDRMLSVKNGKMFEPATICFTDFYRNDQLVHFLKCHGAVKTKKPQACGSNCKTVSDGDKTLRGMTQIKCDHPICEQDERVERNKVFMPNKRARTQTPAAEGARLRNARVDRRTQALVAGAAKANANVRRSARFQTAAEAHDEKTAELNKQVAEDEGMAILAAAAKGPNVRKKSKIHAGYAYSKELKEDALAERISGITGDLQIDFEDNPKLKREMKNLHIDGTEMLRDMGRGMDAAFGLKPQTREEQEAEIAMNNPLFKAMTNKDQKPWAYGSKSNAAPGKKAKHNKMAGFFSVPADQ